MKKYIAGSAILAGILGPVMAFAQTFTITVPTSTASNLTANVGSQISDPGTLYVLLVAVGVPFAFYVIKKVMSLIPKR